MNRCSLCNQRLYEPLNYRDEDRDWSFNADTGEDEHKSLRDCIRHLAHCIAQHDED